MLEKKSINKENWKRIIKRKQTSCYIIENNENIDDCLNFLKRRGAQKFIAINPDTDFRVLDPYLDDIDGILVMTVEPGFAGQKIVPMK